MRGRLDAALARQRAALLADGPASAALRRDRIDRLIHLMLNNAEGLAQDMCTDFGVRAPVQSIATDLFGILPSIKHSRRHLHRWMRPRRVRAGLVGLTGGRAWIQYQPLGVVGIISPWNFPVALAAHPLAEALAAGNRVLLKLSELTPRTSARLQTLLADHFAPEEVTAFTGGPDVGQAFSELPLDHLFFTGGTTVGRAVQRAAADNLVPVTLELGGKSPVVLSPRANLPRAAARIAFGKTLNAGQICLAPDHVFVPAGREDEFARAFASAVAALFPTLRDNADYTALASTVARDRLRAAVDEARNAGARVVEINPADEDFADPPHPKLPPTLILRARPDMQVMREELFGPVLPVLSYNHLDEVIETVNAGPRPLATYWFGPHDADCRRYLARTHSGGAVLNDVFLHAMVDALPFGGVGGSGMGRYHGRAGFETFSHARSVVKAGFLSPNRLMWPPYARIERLLRWMLGLELRAVRRRLGRLKQENPS